MVLKLLGAVVLTAAGTLLPVKHIQHRRQKLGLEEGEARQKREVPQGPEEGDQVSAAVTKARGRTPSLLDSPHESSDVPTSEESSLDDSCPEASDSDDTVRGGRKEIEDEFWEGNPFPEDRVVSYGVDSRDEGTPDRWVKRHPELVRLTGRHPFNCEAPLPRLMEHGFLTPVSLHYVRNHGAVPYCEPSQGDMWTVEVGGLVRRPQVLTVGDLKRMPSRALPVTLVCAGNRRKEQNMVRQTIGFNWGAAGVSTTVWRGVLLRDVLKACGVRNPGTRRGGARKRMPQFVCFEGAETLPGGGGSKYATSLAMEVAMDSSCEVMLAYEQNGQPLAPDHGFPIRMIIPGYIGGRMVKWLKLIEVKEVESDNYYHYHDNRVLPSHVDSESAIRDGWWYKPDFIINELSINSAITTPAHDQALVLPQGNDPKSTFTFRGYSYSGGGRKVIRVELTLDNGRTWRDCEIVRQEKPTEYGKYWCWVFWNVPVPLADLQQCKEVAVRAWDSSMNLQPQQLTWNVMGMMNNCWFRIKLHKVKVGPTGSTVVSFEHPTQAGNLPGGWMTRPEEEESQPEVKPSADVEQSRPAAAATSAAVVPAAAAPQAAETSGRRFSWEEVRKHDKEESAWVVYHGKVYDCTPFLKAHPGGAESILINAGADATEEFDAIHSSKAKHMLKDYFIGELDENAAGEAGTSQSDATVAGSRVASGQSAPVAAESRPVALDPKQRLSFPLIQKDILSQDTRRFRFALQSPEHRLGLPVGKHILVSATVDRKLVMRAYTPSSSDEELGYFDLVVKVYFRGVVSQFPDGGVMSQHLESLAIGESVQVKGPIGHVTYKGRGRFVIDGKERTVKRIAMLAGGTGITPIYQVIQAIMRDEGDETQVSVIYANRTPSDVLLREELDAWAVQRPHAVHMWYTVSNNSGEDTWPYDVGFICEEMVRKHLPQYDEKTLALMCGPPPMLQYACLPNLEKLGYPKEACVSF